MSSHLESVGENEVGLPPLLQKDAGDSIFSSRDGPSSTSALQVDGRLGNVVVNIGQPHYRRDSHRLVNRRESVSSHQGSRASGSAGAAPGGRRWSDGSNHSSITSSRRISAVGAIFESPHISVGMQLVLVAPAFLYAIAVVTWLFEDQDIEISRELAPVSFAALCVHMFAAGETPYLTFWEVVHYWFHAACEVLVANDYTRKIGGGVWGVFLTSVLMLIFWPTGWVMLRRLRIKMNHPSRTSRFPNVGESAMRSGVPLVCLSMYLGTQSLSCLVYTGVTDCALTNSAEDDIIAAKVCCIVVCLLGCTLGTRHLNYSLGTLYVLWMLFRHLTGSNAKQVMLFRLRQHQSYAVVFSFLSTMYSLYEYAAGGIPYKNHVAELMADLIIFVCWFLSIVTIISYAPREHTPAIQYLSTVIPDPTLQIESLEVAPDGAFNETDRRRLSMGPLSRDKGPLGRMLRETGRGRPLSGSQREGSVSFGSPREGISGNSTSSWMDRPGSLHSSEARHMAFSSEFERVSASGAPSVTEADGANHQAPRINEHRSTTATIFRGSSDSGAPKADLGRRSTGLGPSYEAMAQDRVAAGAAAAAADGEHSAKGDQNSEAEANARGYPEPEEYTHPLLKYYKMHGHIPPLSFFTTYLCEIVFFWRFMLFTFTVGYKLFLSLAAYYIMNRHWAQIFTPLSTSALTVSWLLTLGCDPRDRVSQQMMNVHFWFHALSEIPDIIVWFKNGQHLEVIFNVLILLVVWPWVYIAYRRVLRTLRAKYRGQEEDTSVQLFWESSFLMAVEFYLAFQANGCLVHAPAGQESECDNLIHSNLISGMNIILIFLVVRVMLFKLGDLTVTKTLHLALRPYEVLVIIFSVISGLVSIYFLANREDGVTEISEVRQGLEWVTMFLWIVVCLLMAHLTPPVDSFRAKALAELVMGSETAAGADRSAGPITGGRTVIPEGLEERTNDLALEMAASRRKVSRSGTHSPSRYSPKRASNPSYRSPSNQSTARAGANNGSRDGDRYRASTGTAAELNGDRPADGGEKGDGVGGALAPQGSDEVVVNGATANGGDVGDRNIPEERMLGASKEENRCCACWDAFAFWVDRRNAQNNLPVFRCLYFSSTVVYFFVMLGVAAGVIERGYATAVVGVSFASVCSHWLISIEHRTSTMEIVHLLLHACTEAISVLLWVSVRDWTQALYTASAFFAVYPCLFYGIQALKLGLHRKFSDHLALVREAMKIFMRSSVLLMVLLYLAFECIGCLNARSEADCTALLYSNTEVGLSVVLGFLSFLGLIVMQDITARHFLQLNFTWPQVAVLAFSLLAVGLCIFSLASRHFSKLTTDIWEHMIELATLFSWYAALLILWIRRPWYDMSWGDNESLAEEVNGEDGRDDPWEVFENDDEKENDVNGGGDSEPTPEWVQSSPAHDEKPMNLV